MKTTGQGSHRKEVLSIVIGFSSVFFMVREKAQSCNFYANHCTMSIHQQAGLSLKKNTLDARRKNRTIYGIRMGVLSEIICVVVPGLRLGGKTDRHHYEYFEGLILP